MNKISVSVCLCAIMLCSCGQNQTNSQEIVSAEESKEVGAALAEKADPKVCAEKAVLDTVRGEAYSVQPPDLSYPAWEEVASQIDLSFDMVTAISVDDAAKSVSCRARATVNTPNGTNSRQVTYEVLPVLSEEGGFSVNGDFGMIKLQISTAVATLRRQNPFASYGWNPSRQPVNMEGGGARSSDPGLRSGAPSESTITAPESGETPEPTPTREAPAVYIPTPVVAPDPSR